MCNFFGDSLYFSCSVPGGIRTNVGTRGPAGPTFEFLSRRRHGSLSRGDATNGVENRARGRDKLRNLLPRFLVDYAEASASFGLWRAKSFPGIVSAPYPQTAIPLRRRFVFCQAKSSPPRSTSRPVSYYLFSEGEERGPGRGFLLSSAPSEKGTSETHANVGSFYSTNILSAPSGSQVCAAMVRWPINRRPHWIVGPTPTYYRICPRLLDLLPKYFRSSRMLVRVASRFRGRQY